MQKDEIVEILQEVANLLEITEANRFEYMAIRNGAQGLQDWSGDLQQVVANETVTDIPSVGKSIAAMIQDLVTHGSSDEVERVRGLVPPALPQLLRFRGLGPKRVRTLWKELEIESPADLSQAIEDGRVQSLKGFGPKTVDTIKSSLEYFANVPAKPDVRTDLSSAVIRQAPKASGRMWAGTSGYSYAGWKGTFYPKTTKSDDFLATYSKKLTTVEINNTFYRFPSKEVVANWQTQTEEGFLFSLKAHRRVTHQMRLSESANVRIVEFVQRVSEMGDRLGCILYQLPPDFLRDDSRLENLLRALPKGPRYAVEFRHESWMDESVFRRLRNDNVACVSGDAEDQEASQIVTADFVYARLRKTAYTEQELNIWQTWFESLQNDNLDVMLYLKHDDSGEVPNEIAKRWNT